MSRTPRTGVAPVTEQPRQADADPAPAAPAPGGPTPAAPAPVVPAPVMPAPVMPAPVMPAPVMPAPVMPAPVMPAPVVPAPVVPQGSPTVTPAGAATATPQGSPTVAPSATALARSAVEAAGRLLARPTVGLGDVVPAPVSVRPRPAADFVLPADAAVRVSADPAAREVAEHLAELLRPATGYPLPVADLPTAPGPLWLTLGAAAAPRHTGPAAGDEEGYRLDVDPDGVRITADTATGLFHGVQTLRQLLPTAVESRTPVAERWVVPGGTIVDRPRFPYRGAMLDVARHFFGVDDVCRVLDHLARYKLNHLHLHLTDDQGWRIAVDSWPRLTTVGGRTEVGGGPGGWYTAADYRRIVEYAARRHITVVPEVDLPGHTNAALVAYPELAPDKVAPPPYTGTEVGFSHVDPADERTYAFVADVLGELAAATPGPWLHIGGDEAYKVKGAAYTGFVERVQRIVAGLGRTVVGWHQITPAGQVDSRVLQWWGTDGDDPTVAEAVRRGARLILSPGNHAYLDMKYTPDTPLGHNWAGLIDVHRAYHWDPATHLAGVPAEAVLGLEAPLWTESVTSLAEIEFLLLPRLPALAEVAWSTPSTRSWAGFRDRLAGHGPRWHAAGIAFHPSPEIPWPAAPPVRHLPHTAPTSRPTHTTPAHTPAPGTPQPMPAPAPRANDTRTS
ncbi:beta-N-acetylhexosaminidase [Micromonospora sp. WMMD714]|uniref:beta-N-acetylhexosaminidase n=1 Tax=Micromonospora sp. WMMD714 TaxID=3016097 RepID=UPI00249CBEB4|nr:beta-N-acetylhexosaminidase [Micromonospora sp. WMMD714]WFE61829.1 beta-N-acetylhexosaminidase [Micromonospora sp. WMMD714]